MICLGNAFWRDMKAGNTSSLLATLMHEPFHIYFGRYRNGARRRSREVWRYQLHRCASSSRPMAATRLIESTGVVARLWQSGEGIGSRRRRSVSSCRLSSKRPPSSEFERARAHCFTNERPMSGFESP